VAKARELARLRGLKVDWVVADLRTVPLPPATFDLVIQLFVHLPAPERRAILRRALAALRPGGTILVVGYDVRHLASGVGGGPRDPNLLFTVDGVVGALDGLDVDRAERLAVPAGHDKAGVERFAVDVVVRAHTPLA
jgi:SAM-dependent methyltransferase